MVGAAVHTNKLACMSVGARGTWGTGLSIFSNVLQHFVNFCTSASPQKAKLTPKLAKSLTYLSVCQRTGPPRPRTYGYCVSVCPLGPRCANNEHDTKQYIGGSSVRDERP